MIVMNLTKNELAQFQYILPAKGCIKALELVESILKKVEFKDKSEDENEVCFEMEEIGLLLQMIDFLDDQRQIRLDSLSLVKKILNTKETN